MSQSWRRYEWFHVNDVLRQGCVMLPCYFYVQFIYGWCDQIGLELEGANGERNTTVLIPGVCEALRRKVIVFQ